MTEKLAIDGGSKVRSEPFPKRHLYGKEEKAAVEALFDECIETGHLLWTVALSDGTRFRSFDTDLRPSSRRSSNSFDITPPG